MDIVEAIRPGEVTVKVEGEVEEERPEGVRPNSVLVIYDSPEVDFQFSIVDFQHNGSHYLPSKAGDRATNYTLSVDRSNLDEEAFEPPREGVKAIGELSDGRICGHLYPSIFHGAVLPAYNEWRHRRGLEWGETWGTSSRKYDYRPYSIR